MRKVNKKRIKVKRMDIVTLLTAIGTSGILTGLFQWISNRRISRAQAKQTEANADGSVADYVAKIIDQADKRVSQYEADANNWREMITETETYAKEQRLLNNHLRNKLSDEQKARHKAELSLKDFEMKYKESDFHRCEVNGCANRVPPRSRTCKIE